jgi:hypothetical protein
MKIKPGWIALSAVLVLTPIETTDESGCPESPVQGSKR